MAPKKGDGKCLSTGNDVEIMDDVGETDFIAEQDDEWVIINKEPSSRPGKSLRNKPNSAPKGRSQSAMLDKVPRNSVAWSNLHNPNFVGTGPYNAPRGRFVNYPPAYFGGGMECPPADFVGSGPRNGSMGSFGNHSPAYFGGGMGRPLANFVGSGPYNVAMGRFGNHPPAYFGGYMGCPPANCVGGRPNNAAMGSPVNHTLSRHGSSSIRGGCDGMRATKKVGKSHHAEADCTEGDYDDEFLFSDEDGDNDLLDYEEDGMIDGIGMNATNNYPLDNRVSHNSTPKSWEDLGVVQKPSMRAASDCVHFELHTRGKGSGKEAASVNRSLRGSATVPRPASRHGRNCNASKREGRNFEHNVKCSDVKSTRETDFFEDSDPQEYLLTRKIGFQETQPPNCGKVVAGSQMGTPGSIAPWSTSWNNSRPAENGALKQPDTFTNKKETAQPFAPPPYRKLSLDAAAKVGSSQMKPTSHVGKKEASLSPDDFDDDYSDNDSLHDISPKAAREIEASRQKCLEISFPPKGLLNSLPGAVRENNGGRKGGIPWETDTSDSDSYEVSNFQDDEYDEQLPKCVSRVTTKEQQLRLFRALQDMSAKKVEGNSELKQASKLPADKWNKKVCLKNQMKEINEASETGEKETKQVVEQSSAPFFFEEFKHRAKEVVNLIKLHVGQKHEIDTYAPKTEKLLKMHEEKLDMKRRHLEEEQELEAQFAAALSHFVEKQSVGDSNADSSGKL